MRIQDTLPWFRMTIMGFLCLVAASAFSSPAPQLEWVTSDIGGGGALVFASINPHNPQEVLVATDMSAIFRTLDFGESWHTIPFTTIAGIYDADWRFTADPQIIYAIDWYDVWWLEQRAVRSNDGGVSFTPLPPNPHVPSYEYATRLLADPYHTDRIIIGFEPGIFFSPDGGTTYNMVAQHDGTGPHGIRLAGVHWDGTNMVVATNQGLYSSTDGGLAFFPLDIQGLPDGEGIAKFEVSSSGNSVHYFAVTLSHEYINPPMGMPDEPTRLFRSTNGAPWTELVIPDSQPFFIETFNSNLDTLNLAGAVLRDGGSVPGVWRTEDGGDNWQLIFNTENNQNIATGWQGDGAPIDWWYDAVAYGFDADPNNPSHLIMTSHWVFTSTNAGQTWQAATVKPEDRNQPGSPVSPVPYETSGIDPTTSYALHWVGSDTLIASCTDLSAKLSVDGGCSWQDGAQFGLPFNTVYHVISGSGGRLYAAVAEVHDMYYEAMDEDLENGPHPGGIYYSDDHGASWQSLGNFGAPVVWLAMDPSQDNTLYCSVVDNDRGGIYVTHDLHWGPAANFQILPAPARTNNRPFNIYVLSDGTLVTTWSVRMDTDDGSYTATSGVFISSDGGQTWQDRSHENMHFHTMDLVINPHDADENTWLVAVQGTQTWADGDVSEHGGLYRTEDRGITWERILSNHIASRVLSVAVDPNDPQKAWVSTHGHGLLITENLTESLPDFSLDHQYPFRSPTRVFWSPDGDEMWATSFGGGIMKKQISSTSTAVHSSQPSNWLQMNSIHPNPFNPQTSIAFSLERDSWVTICIYDSAGRRIKKQVLGHQNTGRHKMEFSGNGLASGVYLVEIMAASGGTERIVVGKMVLIQ